MPVTTPYLDGLLETANITGLHFRSCRLHKDIDDFQFDGTPINDLGLGGGGNVGVT